MAEMLEDEGFLTRAFQPSELSDHRAEHLAGILAAKEALFKALDMPPRWDDVEVYQDRSGRPRLRILDGAERPHIISLDLSITHDGEYAAAIVAALLSEEDEDACQHPG